MKKWKFKESLILIPLLGAALGCEDTKQDSGPEPAPFQIESLPANLMKPGVYTLSKDLSWESLDSSPIHIYSSNVSLDFDGYKIEGLAGNTTRTAGVVVEDYAERVVIQNGKVTGFFYGAYVASTTSDVTVQNMNFDHIYSQGIYSTGEMTKVLGNSISNLGGTRAGAHVFSFGVQIIGPKCEIKENQISEFFPTGDGEGVGISVSSDGKDCVVENNHIENSRPSPSGRTFGLWLGANPGDGTIGLRIEGNLFAGMTYAMAKTQAVDAVFIENTTTNSDCASFTGFVETSDLISNTFDGPISQKRPGCSDTAEYWKPRAEAGRPSAMFRYAAVAPTLKDQYYWYRRAANVGHTEAARVADKLIKIYPSLGN